MLLHECLSLLKLFSERNKSAHLNIKAKKKEEMRFKMQEMYARVWTDFRWLRKGTICGIL
jgi:hypothetical protein